MQQVTFNNAGVQSLLANINKLSVSDYQLEIQQIRQDFGAWLLKRFTFNPRQLEYLSQLEADYLYLLGEEVSQAIETQTPIILQQASRADDDDDDGEGKVIEMDSRSQLVYRTDEGVESTSVLNIHIHYQAN